MNETNYIYFQSSSHHRKQNLYLNLFIDNVKVNRVDDTLYWCKYLIINSSLSFHVAGVGSLRSPYHLEQSSYELQLDTIHDISSFQRPSDKHHTSLMQVQIG